MCCYIGNKENMGRKLFQTELIMQRLCCWKKLSTIGSSEIPKISLVKYNKYWIPTKHTYCLS